VTERWSAKDYNDYLLGKCPAPKITRSAKVKRKNDVALLLLVNRLRAECGIIDGGIWQKDMAVTRDTLYREYPGITGRKFRFDLAIPSRQIAIEIHGGAYVKRKGGSIGGAHHSIEGRRRDMEKARLANVQGWCYLEFEWRDIGDGTCFDLVQQLVV